MVRKSILLIGTYPIKNAQHGGQKRMQAIMRAYRKHFGTVRYVGVFFKGFYKDYSEHDIALGDRYTKQFQESPFTGDVLCGNAIFDDPEVKRRMIAHIREIKPDIIEIEQGYPYLGLRRLLAELDLHPKLVFSSHNVEAPMKREILEGAGVPETEVKRIEQEIADIEQSLAQASDLVIGCTPADVQAYKRMGAKHTVLAPNGMAPIHTTDTDLRQWQDRFAEEGIAKTVLFVGSAHPPNWTGFSQMIGLGMGFLAFDTRLLLAGGICDYFENNIKESNNIEHATFWQRVIACGRPSDDSLGALIQLADVIVLPLTEGGGSNLKTAEAILADKPIVATSHAFRSYEKYVKLPNIYIADTPKAFRAAIGAALAATPRKRTVSQQELASQVLWQNRLKDLVNEVTAL